MLYLSITISRLFKLNLRTWCRMKLLRLLLVVFEVSLVGGTSTISIASEEKFRAASVKVDITPDKPQWLHGYGPRKSEGVHDRIFHRIVAMEDSKTKFFLVASDICTITPSFYDEVCKKLEKETGIRSEQIWWTATHTHAAPHVGPQDLGQLFENTLGDRFSIDHDEDHWEFVAQQLIDGVKIAQKQLEPARLGVGVGEAFANVNRREVTEDGRIKLGVNPTGPVDRQLGLIRLERHDGSPIALIANYAIHATALGSKNKLISGDVPGLVAKYVESQIGAPLLFINGAEGNIGPLYSVGDDFEHPQLQAYNKLLGEKILEVNESIKNTSNTVRLSLASTIIDTPRREDLGWIEELQQYSSTTDSGMKMVRVPIRSLVINDDTVIWSAPLELFCEIAMNARQASPFRNTFYFGLTNGSLLYMPTSRAFAERGYEVGVSVFTPRAEKDISYGVIQHLQSLPQKK